MKRSIVMLLVLQLVICSFNVSDVSAAKTKLAVKKMNLEVGAKKKIKFKKKNKGSKYLFTSKKKTVAKVTKKGVVKALKKGVAVIQVKEKKRNMKKTVSVGKVKVCVSDKAVNPTPDTPNTEATNTPAVQPTQGPTTEPTEEPIVEPTAEPTPEVPASIDKSFIDTNYNTPSDFDQKKNGVTYGEVVSISYYSEIAEMNRNAKVILPPNYDEGKEYPILYLLHGIGGNENEWLDGTPNEIVSNMIAAGTAKEMIMVLPDQTIRHKDEPGPGYLTLEQFKMFDRMKDDLETSLIPYMEENYPIKEGRDNHAVAGLSMGGRNAIYIGVTMVDYFAYVGAFCPAIGVLPYEREGGLLTTETLTIPEENRKNTLFVFTAGEGDTTVGDWPKTYSDTLKNNGFDHIYYTWPGGHWWGPWKNGLYNLARRAFQ